MYAEATCGARNVVSALKTIGNTQSSSAAVEAAPTETETLSRPEGIEFETKT